MEENVIEKRVWSTKQLISAIIITASIVFSGSMIWSRFLFTESQINVVDLKHTEAYSVLSARLDKKTARLEADNAKQWEVINKILEK